MLADAPRLYQSLLGPIDKRFSGNFARFTQAPGQAPGALFLGAERLDAELVIHALAPPYRKYPPARENHVNPLFINYLFFNALLVFYRVKSHMLRRWLVHVAGLIDVCQFRVRGGARAANSAACRLPRRTIQLTRPI